MPIDSLVERLASGFDTHTFREFINLKCAGTFAPLNRDVPVDEDTPWGRAEQLGVVKLLPGPNLTNRPLIVVVAELPEGETLRERSSRLRQFRFGRAVLEDAVANPSPDLDGLPAQGLFVFHDRDGNFRLSLVYATPKGTKLEWSTFKRYSFYVEAGAGNKTFRDRAALPWTTFDQLSDAFSVEKLTKEFYRRLFDWYQRAMNSSEVIFPNDIVTDREPRAVKSEQIIRLITRLMFVWFLKQKHLVPDQLFDADALREILRDFSPADGYAYYRAILQNLFFATLNSEIPDRAFAADGGTVQTNAEHFDIKTLYRYGGDFARSREKVIELFHGIPFLNGGLFECLDRGRSYYDGFSRESKKQAQVPNTLFFDDAGGLLPLLQQYNFTVEENSPGDEEVALDPELLGKVFENLLAAYNPETNVQARKATGSFYTPREIVNYMVDESLIAHLSTKCGAEHETEIRTLLKDGIPPEDPELSHQIDIALTTARVLDPACGSGAFPMGALLRMVSILRTVRRIPEDQSVYDLKLELIENAIYGADIQTIAVQISKLRFFISLLAEQQPSDDADNNYGIHSLPNLETKFVAGNSLIGLPHASDALPMHDVEALKKHLWDVRHRHFEARSYREKKELRKEDQALRTALAEALEDGGGFDTEAAHLMAAWDPYDQNTSATFLDPDWMFNVRGGFDVVIGNPPYISALDFKRIYGENLRVRLGKSFESATGAYDYFILFIELGVKLLAKGGILSFITPNKYLSAKYGSGLRKWLLRNASVDQIVDVSEIPVFAEASVYPVLSFIRKTTKKKGSVVSVLPMTQPLMQFAKEHFESIHVPANFLDLLPENIWGFLLSRQSSVLTKIVRTCPRMSEIGSVNATTTAAEADAYGQLLSAAGGDGFAKVVNTGTIDPYQSLWGQKAMTHQGKKFLTPFLPMSDPKIAARRKNLYRQSKVIFAKMGRKCEAFIDLNGDYASLNTNCFYGAEDGYSVIYVGAVCNSRAFQFIYALFFGSLKMSGGYYQFQAPQLRVMPIPAPSTEMRRRVENLAQEVMAIKEGVEQSDSSKIEAKIDQLVYKLYDLTPEEIAIVEESATPGATKISEPEPTAKSTHPLKKTTSKLPPSLPGWD